MFFHVWFYADSYQFNSFSLAKTQIEGIRKIGIFSLNSCNLHLPKTSLRSSKELRIDRPGMLATISPLSCGSHKTCLAVLDRIGKHCGVTPRSTNCSSIEL